MKIEELRAKMCIPADASKGYIMKTIEEIAEILKNECVIKYRNEEYRILDFEFYFFNKNHQDISVHPRNSKALSWYINEFGGIDLNFESSIEREMVKKARHGLSNTILLITHTMVEYLSVKYKNCLVIKRYLMVHSRLLNCSVFLMLLIITRTTLFWR